MVMIWWIFLSFLAKMLSPNKCLQKLIFVLSSLVCKRIDILLVRARN
jgi:hypothetical protein